MPSEQSIGFFDLKVIGIFISLFVCQWIAKAIIYKYFFHPLRHVPGPWIARFTDKWLKYNDFLGRRTGMIHNYHTKYGPVVRLAPDELSFASVTAIKEIYGQGTTLRKTAFYSGFEEPNMPNLFTSRDPGFHRDRRKLLSHAFAPKSIITSEPLVAEQVRNLLNWLEHKQDSDMDVFMWFRNLALDIVSALFMGEAIGGLKEDVPHAYLQNIDAYFLLAGLKLQFPWLLQITSWLPLRKWQHFLLAQTRLYDFGRASFDRYVKRYGRESKREDPLRKILNGDATLPPLSDREVCSEVGSILVAGTDTTSTVLTYAFWELSKDPAMQRRLRNEMADAQVIFENRIPPYKELERLEFLNVFTLEALRLHTAACASLPREVPPEGADICGIKVPGGTTVSTQAYTQHQHSDLFPQPEKFEPDRWLKTMHGGTQAMREAYIPFSRGPRMCPGMYIATMELKLIIASVIGMFQVELGERTTDEVMDMEDHFVLMPKGGFCDLIFRKV